MRTLSSNRRLSVLVPAVCTLILAVTGGAAVSEARAYSPLPATQPVRASLGKGSAASVAAARQREIVGVLSGHYYRSVDVTRLAHIPLAKLAAELDDPYTTYLTPAKLREYNRTDTGTYAGVGVHAKIVEHTIVLDWVTAGGPAAAAGLRAGDVVVSADGHPLRGLDLETALKKVRGRIGTKVNLRIARGDHSLTFAVRRAEVQARIVSHEVRRVSGRKVGYLQVLEFSRGVGKATQAAVEDFKAQGVDEVVLDLRHNGGGLTAEAVALTAVFTPSGTPVFVESGKHFESTIYSTHTAPADTKIPLVVLVDDQTASAAEIVTGALSDAGRATVVGAKTFGKGVIQDLAPLKGGGALKYTMGEYLTPSGHKVNRVGITPDVVVAAKSKGGSDKDSAFDVAVRTLKKQDR